MARRKSFSSSFYKAARISRNVEVWSSGNPARIARRYKNRWLGRHVVGKMWRWP